MNVWAWWLLAGVSLVAIGVAIWATIDIQIRKLISEARGAEKRKMVDRYTMTIDVDSEEAEAKLERLVALATQCGDTITAVAMDSSQGKDQETYPGYGPELDAIGASGPAAVREQEAARKKVTACSSSSSAKE